MKNGAPCHGPAMIRRPHSRYSELLEPVAEPDGWFGAMGDAIRALERQQTVSRALVDEAAILGADEELIGDVDIGAGAIDERRAGLGGNSGCVSGVEDQSAGAGFGKRREAVHLMTEYIGRAYFMLIGLDSERAGFQAISLGVERVTVVDFNSVTGREKEAVISQHAAAIGGGLVDSVVRGGLDETAECLDAHFRPVEFLRKRRHGRQRYPHQN